MALIVLTASNSVDDQWEVQRHLEGKWWGKKGVKTSAAPHVSDRDTQWGSEPGP